MKKKSAYAIFDSYVSTSRAAMDAWVAGKRQANNGEPGMSVVVTRRLAIMVDMRKRRSPVTVAGSVQFHVYYGVVRYRKVIPT